jgi:hypothetical protein
MATQLHAHKKDENSPVFWGFVRARAKATTNDGITDHTVEGEEAVAELHSWDGTSS